MTPQDIALKRELEQVAWPIEYGTITLQLRDGRPTLVKIERTIKLD